MNNQELQEIYGGLSITSTLINSLIKAGTSLYELGKRFGTALVRTVLNRQCY